MTIKFFPEGCVGVYQAKETGENILSGRKRVTQVPSFIPELGRSPGEGNSYPLQYSGLENSIDCIIHEVAKS